MKTSYIIFIFFFLLSCENESTKDIVLKLGDYELTQFEYEKNFLRYYQKISETEKAKQWENEFLYKCYFISDAYKKHYDTINSLIERTNFIADLMMVQQYGYLWQETIAPIVNSYKKLDKEKIDRRGYIYYFDYIATSQIENFINYNEQDTIISLQEFNYLKSLCHSNQELKTGYISLQWPFLSFWEYRNQLIDLQEGDITSPLIVDGDYIVLLLDRKERFNVTDSDKEELMSQLVQGIEEEIDRKKTKEMDYYGKPQINKQNLDSLYHFLICGNNLKDYSKNVELITYTLKGNRETIYCSDFIKFFTNLPLQAKLDTYKELTFYLNQIYYNKYLVLEAKELGLYEVDTFQLEMKSFYEKLMFAEYLKSEIEDKVEISQNEIEAYYQVNKNHYFLNKNLIGDIFIFKTEQDAHKALNMIKIAIESNNYNKLLFSNDFKNQYNYIELNFNQIIHLDKEKSFSYEFKRALSNQDVNSIYPLPIKKDSSYFLFYKKSVTDIYKPNFNEVFNTILNELRRKKIEVFKQERLNQLKAENIITINKTIIKKNNN